MSAAMFATFCARMRTIRSWLSGSYETFPVTSAFSSPPIRCSRPGVPGIAHWRASVSGSRLIRQEAVAVVGEPSRTASRCRAASDTSGISHGSDAVGQVGVGQEEDRSAVLQRDPCRLDRRVEAPGRASRRRRPARGSRRSARSSTMSRSACSGFVGMPVDGPARWTSSDHQRQLERDGEPDGLGLEHDAGPGRGGDAERAAERGAERGAARGDLVLCLERDHTEVLVLRELLEDRRGRRDRVGAEKELQAESLRRGDEPVGERLVAGDLPVGAGRERARVRPRTRRRSPRRSRRSCSRP